MKSRNNSNGFDGGQSPNFNNSNGGPGAPIDHACPLNRNCRARCRALDAGELPAALRWFKRNHNWHERGRMTNLGKLRLAFKKPVRSAVNTLLADRLDGLTAKIEEVFSKLQHHADTLDDLRITDEDELVTLEHTMAYLDEGLGDLADLIESGQNCLTGTGDQTGKSGDACCRSQNRSGRKIVDISPDTDQEQWITYQAAADILFVDKSTVSRWVKRGILKSNEKKGRSRRVDKGSVLIKRRRDDDEAARREENNP